MALSFAPLRRPPLIQRVLNDDRWNLSFTLELYKVGGWFHRVEWWI